MPRSVHALVACFQGTQCESRKNSLHKSAVRTFNPDFPCNLARCTHGLLCMLYRKNCRPGT